MTENSKTAEQISFELISHAGNSKSCSMEAMTACDNGDYEGIPELAADLEEKKETLIDNKEIAISREELLSKVWGYNFFGDDRTIDTHIKMLRNNLGKYRDLIVTVRGVGYKFEEK